MATDRELAPAYVPPGTLRREYADRWASENPDATATEALAEVARLDREVAAGEYRDEKTGDRVVWVADRDEALQAQATGAVDKAKAIHDKHVGPIRDQPAGHPDHQTAAERVQAELEEQGVDAKAIVELTARADTGHWEVYDPFKHGADYRPAVNVPGAEPVVVAKEASASVGTGADSA